MHRTRKLRRDVPPGPPAAAGVASTGGRARAAQRGQSVLEFGLTTAIAIAMLFAALQIAVIVVQQYGAAHVARRTARWLAVNIDALDSTTLSQARTFADGLPGLGVTGMTNVTTAPACGSHVGGKCALRESGQAVSVTVTTSLTPIMFLPSSIGIGRFQYTFPTGPYTTKYTVLLE